MSGMNCYRVAQASLAMILIGFICVLPGSAQQPRATSPVTLERLFEGVYFVKGGVGADIVALVGTEGVILLDPKETPETAKQVVAELAKVTPKPITHIVVTHSNPDHTRGLPGYPKGMTIIA